MDYTFVITFVVFFCLKGASAQYLHCTFEGISICGLIQLSSDDFDWTRHSGSTGSSSTGPSYDHTLGTTAGYYMYTEASAPRVVGEKAVLTSPNQPPTNGTCLQFWYHMYGINMGSLGVFLRQGSQNTRTILSASGNKSNVWLQRSYVITSPTSTWSVRFEGTRGSGYESDIAIDDVSITPGPCGVECTFDRDFCSWSNVGGDDYNWLRHTGSTPSSFTGPTVDHTQGSTSGGYTYIESSNPSVGDVAWLDSPIFPVFTSGIICFNFWFHMYGADIGTLNVYIVNSAGTNRRLLWSQYGNQGNHWIQSTMPISSQSERYKVRFEGTRGSGLQSDIAIDDVSITSGPCGVECTFDRDFCSWSNVGGDDFNWLRHTGSTPSRFTGPTVDHTQGSTSGGYTYIESSNPSVGDVAWLDSPIFPVFTSGIICFNFWFHMYGADIGTLNVYIVNSTGTNRRLLWSQYGNQGNHWIQSTMPISSQSERYKIRFEGERGSDIQGDIAIDDVSFSSSSECRHTHCSPGKYGSQCTSSCLSANCRNNQCDRSSGYCAACTDNFVGNTCTDCSPGKYGPQCTSSCRSANCRNNQCDRSSGYCAACTDNFVGNTCTDCRPGKYGPQCASSCLSVNCRNNQCHRSTGRCLACTDNFTGTSCLDCSPGKYGPQCTSSCRSANCRNNQCDRSSGYCAACTDNFVGNTCTGCVPGKFGSDCSLSCLSSNCLNNECNATTRLCNACPDYFQGDFCNDCVPGRYGSDCSSPCLSSTCANNQCNKTTGLCDVCLDNLDGGLCSALPSSYDWTLTIAGAAAGVGVLVIICVIACICCLRRSRAKWEETEPTAPPIPLSEMEPAPELRSPPSRAVEGAGAEADDPDSVYEKIRISCIGAENNTYSEFPPQRAEATEPESLYVNVGFS